RDAPLMGEWLAESLYNPDKFIVSTAVRAQQTARAFQEALSLPDSNFSHEPDLYHAGMQEWIRVLENLNPVVSNIAFFAHNPGITQIVNWLCEVNIFNIPTCGVAIVQIPQTLERIDSGVGKLLHYQTPKKLLGID
ncbi:MAG: hypothetical protein KJO88_07155, partial [Gammaproteobacteria bacterium]|nr:hypothetical protein [Gammaproteobacteria bacterium]